MRLVILCVTRLVFSIKSEKKAYFGKNSDRSPNERQVIEYLPSKRHREKEVKVTYLTIPEVEKTNALIISRPSWMWGCEMGVNEFGVCIGNEALFTEGKYAKKGLTGIDLVRLGLERGKSALEALTIIISLLDDIISEVQEKLPTYKQIKKYQVIQDSLDTRYK